MDLSTIVAIFILGWIIGFGMACTGCYRYITVRRELYEARESLMRERDPGMQEAMLDKIVLDAERTIEVKAKVV